MTLADGAIAVFRGEANADAVRAGKVGPVYQLGSGGTVAVPTGRVFLRFRAGVEAATRRPEIEAAGYRLEEVPSYASHAAWLLPKKGDIAGALAGIDELKKLPDVEAVEPEMLRQSARRGTSESRRKERGRDQSR